MKEETHVGAFLRSFFTGWLAGLSGLASGGLLLVGLFVADNRPYTLTLAAVCFLAAAYGTWRSERIRAKAAEARLRTTLRLHTQHDSCVMVQGKDTYFRVAVANTGSQAAEGVVAHMVGIDPMPEEFRGKLPLPLQFMHHPAGTELTLRAGAEGLVDVFVTQPGGRHFTVFHTLREKVPVFIPARNYRVDIEATPANAAGVRRRFRFETSETGNRLVEDSAT